MERSIEIPVPFGELFDKITILQIKVERLVDSRKVLNSRKELSVLCERRDMAVTLTPELEALTTKLKLVNERIWELEDVLHECERSLTFDSEFVTVARDTYKANDHRAAIKREISILLGSDLIEEKSHM